MAITNITQGMTRATTIHTANTTQLLFRSPLSTWQFSHNRPANNQLGDSLRVFRILFMLPQVNRIRTRTRNFRQAQMYQARFRHQ